jgi:hypothetical protein
MRHHLPVGALCLILSAIPPLSSDEDQLSTAARRREESDVAKLAAITKVDHSTIFFLGRSVSGYVRNGSVYVLDLPQTAFDPRRRRCSGRAVSRDGTRLAYIVTVDDGRRCEILVRDLEKGSDVRLAEVVESFGMLSWSWDDREIAYQTRRGIFAVSVADGQERIVVTTPLVLDTGPQPSRSYLLSADWLHNRSELLGDLSVCIPASNPAICNITRQTLLLSPGNSRQLTVGGGAAESPSEGQIAVVTHGDLRVMKMDGSPPRKVIGMPLGRFCNACIAEFTNWSKIVWSPSGDRVWFSTMNKRSFSANSYLVDLGTKRRRRILKNTFVIVTDWR